MTVLRLIIGLLLALPIVLLLGLAAGLAGVLIAIVGCFVLLAAALGWARAHTGLHHH